MTMFKDLAVTATFESSAKIKWLVLVGKVGKLWRKIKLEEKIGFLAPISRVTYDYIYKKEKGIKNYLY